MIMFKHVMMLFCKFMPKKEKRKKNNKCEKSCSLVYFSS